MSSSLLKRIFSREKRNEYTPFLNKFIEQEKHFSDYEKNMITNIVNLSGKTVKEIMVPRVDVVLIDKDSEIDEIINIVESKGRSRLPVFEDTLDNIVGVLHAKELLKYFIHKENFNLSLLIRKPFFVPESKSINDLLVEMREQKNHLAVVVDEYGGMSGIVCLEDIIEEIVGEIQDEFDNEVDDIIEMGKNEYLINARMTLEELNSKLALDFNEEDIDTFGGLIYMLFGRIPARNEKIQYKNFIFTIVGISGRKISNIQLTILEDAANEKS